MEGGPSVFAEPNEIAERYHKAVAEYFDGLRRVVLESAVDYHRATLDEGYDHALSRFLIGRASGKGKGGR
jgi:hypothetical protein